MELKSVEDTSWLQLFIKNSRYRLFTATPSGYCSKYIHQKRHTFSRSYGVNLPEFLNEGYLKRLRIFSLPTCVGLRYGQRNTLHCGTFLGSMGSVSLWAKGPPLHSSGLISRLLSVGDPCEFEPTRPIVGLTYPSPSSLAASKHTPLVQEY